MPLGVMPKTMRTHTTRYIVLCRTHMLESPRPLSQEDSVAVPFPHMSTRLHEGDRAIFEALGCACGCYPAEAFSASLNCAHELLGLDAGSFGQDTRIPAYAAKHSSVYCMAVLLRGYACVDGRYRCLAATLGGAFAWLCS
eukprot:2549144-Amphidinium_carterae.1